MQLALFLMWGGLRLRFFRRVPPLLSPYTGTLTSEMRFVAVGFRFVIVSASVHARVSVVRMRTSPNSNVVLSGLAE